MMKAILDRVTASGRRSRSSAPIDATKNVGSSTGPQCSHITADAIDDTARLRERARLALCSTQSVRCRRRHQRGCFVNFPTECIFLDDRKQCELAHIAVTRLRVTLMPGNELKSAEGPNESRAGCNYLALPFDYRSSSRHIQQSPR